MWLCKFCVVLFVTTVKIANCQVFSYQPEQIHLAFGDNTSQIVVTWSTFNQTTESVVEYGINGFALRAFGAATLFVDGGPKKHAQYIHRVFLNNLTPDSKYGNYNSRKNQLTSLFHASIYDIRQERILHGC